MALFDSVAGVEPQSETVWRQADKYGVGNHCPPLAILLTMSETA